MLGDPRLKKEYMFMVAWFDYQFHRHHGLHRHHDHHHHKNNVHNVHGQLDHQTISIDWNQLFSAMPLRRNKQTTDQRLDPTFFGASAFVFLSAPKEQANNLNCTATQERSTKQSNPHCLSENQTDCLSKKQTIGSNFFLHVKQLVKKEWW